MVTDLGKLVLIAHPARLQVDESREYSDKVMEIEGILEFKDKFLPLHNPWEVGGHVTRKSAEETGLLEGTPVASIGWDVVCCSSGVGAVKDGSGCSSTPTTFTASNRAGSSMSTCCPSARAAAFAMFHGTPQALSDAGDAQVLTHDAS